MGRPGGPYLRVLRPVFRAFRHALFAGLLTCGAAVAQTAPAPASAPSGPSAPATATRIDVVEFRGAQSIPAAQLQAAVRGWTGRDLTVAEMGRAADAVTDLYRRRGFMVATAYVPAQTIRDRTLRITVVEGVFSDIRVRSNTSGVPDAVILRTLSTNLCGRPDSCRGRGPVRKDAVERAGLLVTEIPGVRATYELSPGEEDGSTSVFADVTAAPKVSGTAGVDNSGLAVTGRWRGALALRAANVLRRGDQASFSGSYSGKGFVSFSADASAPVGAKGLRAGVTAGHLRYALGREFAALDATGASDVAGAYVSYPLARGFRRTADVRGDVAAKRIRNSLGVLGLDTKAISYEASAAISGSATDDAGGTTQARVTATAGQLSLRDAVSRRFDAATARTDGTFGKIGFTVSREQAIRAGWSAFAQVTGQMALNNLDASEKFGLAGPQGVRAFATGAVAADTAVLFTAETRIALPQAWIPGHLVSITPFYDYGWAQLNAQDWTGYAGAHTVQLAGGGVYLSVVAPGRYALKAGVAVRQNSPSGVAPSARERVWVEAAAAF